MPFNDNDANLSDILPTINKLYINYGSLKARMDMTKLLESSTVIIKYKKITISKVKITL